jgi:DNA repair exonuclease SbcCD nuclease subunit
MNNPTAVIIGDIHYNLQTLPLADASLRMAIRIANDLNVPCIVNGDLHDTKAILRAECVNAILSTTQLANEIIINVGNHDLINERGEDNALKFLASSTYLNTVITEYPNFRVIPYYADVAALRTALASIPHGKPLILHQGLTGAHMGEYMQDKSALNPSDLASFRTILSHYHRRQDIKCGRPQKGAIG